MRTVIIGFLISLIIVVVQSYPRFSPGGDGLRLTDAELRAIERALLRQLYEANLVDHGLGDEGQGRLPLVKRNYNLDHLARMNFRRSFRASKLNNRHILGGL